MESATRTIPRGFLSRQNSPGARQSCSRYSLLTLLAPDGLGKLPVVACG